MNFLSNNEKWRGQRPMEHHLLLMKSITQSEVNNEEIEYELEEYDKMMYAGLTANIIGMFNQCPLHLKVGSGNIDIKLHTILQRESGTGSSSSKFTTEKTFEMFTDAEDVCMLTISRGSRHKRGTNYSQKAGGQRSVYAKLAELVRDQDYSITDGIKSRHIVSRITGRNSCATMCFNMYTYVQKCILAYTVSRSEVETTPFSVEIVDQNTASTRILCDRDYIINANLFSDEEIMIMYVGLEGHRNVEVVESRYSDKESVYGQIMMEAPSYAFVSSTDARGQYRQRTRLQGTCTIIPPEKAIRLVQAICGKLKCTEQYCRIAETLRGIYVFREKTRHILRHSEVLLERYDDNINGLELDEEADSCVHTVFGCTEVSSAPEIASGSNLDASSVNLMVECIHAQLMVNNIHYFMEMYGLNSSDVYSKYNGQFETMLAFTNCVDEYDGKQQMSSVCRHKERHLGGFMAELKIIKMNYFNLFRTGNDYTENVHKIMMWPQIDVLVGSLNREGSIVSVLGRKCVVGAMESGVLIKNSEEASKNFDAMYMYGMTNDDMRIGGNASVLRGGKYNAHQGIVSHMSGTYGLSHISMNVFCEQGLEGRIGIETTVGSRFFFKTKYKSTGADVYVKELDKLNELEFDDDDGYVEDGVNARAMQEREKARLVEDEARNEYLKEVSKAAKKDKYRSDREPRSSMFSNVDRDSLINNAGTNDIREQTGDSDEGAKVVKESEMYDKVGRNSNAYNQLFGVDMYNNLRTQRKSKINEATVKMSYGEKKAGVSDNFITSEEKPARRVKPESNVNAEEWLNSKIRGKYGVEVKRGFVIDQAEKAVRETTDCNYGEKVDTYGIDKGRWKPSDFIIGHHMIAGLPVVMTIENEKGMRRTVTRNVKEETDKEDINYYHYDRSGLARMWPMETVEDIDSKIGQVEREISIDGRAKKASISRLRMTEEMAQAMIARINKGGTERCSLREFDQKNERGKLYGISLYKET